MTSDGIGDSQSTDKSQENEQSQAIWNEIIKIAQKYVERAEDEITAAEFGKQSGMSAEQAKAYLDRLYRKGILDKRLIPNFDGNGGRIALYRPTGK